MAPKPTVAILAGGLATRLGELTKHTPKSLLDVNGRPFLAWQLELLAQRGIDDVVICVGHLGEQIQERMVGHVPASMRLHYSTDGASQLGTGGAIKQALPLLSDPFLVTYGDSYLVCDYLRVYDQFVHAVAAEADPDARPLGLMTVYRNDDQLDSSNVVFRDGRVVNYSKIEKVPDMCFIDWGLGVLSHAAFDAFRSQLKFDLALTFAALVTQHRLAGLEMRQRFYEIGSVTGLDELRRVLGQAPIAR